MRCPARLQKHQACITQPAQHVAIQARARSGERLIGRHLRRQRVHKTQERCGDGCYLGHAEPLQHPTRPVGKTTGPTAAGRSATRLDNPETPGGACGQERRPSTRLSSAPTTKRRSCAPATPGGSAARAARLLASSKRATSPAPSGARAKRGSARARKFAATEVRNAVLPARDRPVTPMRIVVVENGQSVWPTGPSVSFCAELAR